MCLKRHEALGVDTSLEWSDDPLSGSFLGCGCTQYLSEKATWKNPRLLLLLSWYMLILWCVVYVITLPSRPLFAWCQFENITQNQVSQPLPFLPQKLHWWLFSHYLELNSKSPLGGSINFDPVHFPLENDLAFNIAPKTHFQVQILLHKYTIHLLLHSRCSLFRWCHFGYYWRMNSNRSPLQNQQEDGVYVKN